MTNLVTQAAIQAENANDIDYFLLIVGLLGINLGVELGQLAVIALALAATFWIRDPKQYRRIVVIPSPLPIAAMGIWWVLERTILS